MALADFIHLRVHSAYSLSEGAITPAQLVDLAKRAAMPAVAVADTNNLFGAMEFSGLAKAAGIQPIIGCQIDIRREAGNNRQAAAPATDQLVLLVQNEAGYGNLMKLSSHAFLASEPGAPPQIALADLEAHAEGLIALTAGPRGEVGRLILEGRDAEAKAALARFAAIFPGRCYVEIMRHGEAAEDRCESALIDLAYTLDLPLVATNEVFFADRDMYPAHDALLCIAERSYVVEEKRRRATPEHGFKSAAEMRALFADLPEACDNTLIVARRCAYMPPARKAILPLYAPGKNEAEILETMAREGLARRLESLGIAGKAAEPYAARLDFELGIINGMGFTGYFLIVADFIQWAKGQGIPVGPGRGSGAGSVVAWALTITGLDPLRFGLLFERFLNPERISMPDFDIDFCQDRRDEVIRYVQERFGPDRVAQIITFGKLQARAAVRDVGRVLQVPYGQVDRLTKLIPNNPANPIKLREAIEGEPQLRQAIADDPAVARLMDIAEKLEGLYRHASTHAAGIVIGDRPLDELVPLYRDPNSSMLVTQFNMKDVEKAGLVKFDFLGLKTLSLLDRAIRLLKKRGIEIDLDRLPLDDAKTYEMLCHADVTGVFQLESSGMRDVLRKLKPDRFEDIVAVVALYRPGPMDNIPRFINGKHGREAIDYLHPLLEGILKETYGIMIYQEQVLEIARVLAGYSLGSADLLRRAMGKKIKSEMEAQRKTFIDGAIARGVEAGKAGQIFDQVNKFAGYGFNKSHAAAYAMVAYQTAWMKANYPVEFFAASMTYDMSNSDKLNLFRQELKRLGIALLPPDINRSEVDFAVEVQSDERLAVRYALAAVKNVGAGPVAAIVAARGRGRPFAGLEDFCERLAASEAGNFNKRQLENLILAGAFDSLNSNRHQVFTVAEQMLRQAGVMAAERATAQSTLFAETERVRLTLPPVNDWLPTERLQQEFAAIGFYLSAHPLDAYAETLKRLSVIASGDLMAWLKEKGTTRAKLAGLVVARQERVSQKGNRFAFVQLSDASGLYEVMVFAEKLSEAREWLEPGRPILLTVDARIEEDNLRLMAVEIAGLDQAAAAAATGLRIFLKTPDALASIKQVLDRAGRGKGRVDFVLDLEDLGREVEIALPGRYAVSPAVKGAIKAIPGILAVAEA